MKRKHIYVDTPLKTGDTVRLPPHTHHRLTKVLRLPDGAELSLFNGVDGVFAGLLQQKTVLIQQQLHSFKPLPALCLLIGLPKKEAMDRILRQATELGVRDIYPLLTDYAVPDKLNLERAQAILIEAAEQCERMDIPTLHAPADLQKTLGMLQFPITWAYERHHPASAVPLSSALLVGPEGGFSPAEVAFLAAQPKVSAYSLGQTILRVDTAVVAGLAAMRRA